MSFDEDDYFARYDDHRERYGDPCPGCGTLRWQGDCPKCYLEDMPAKDEPPAELPDDVSSMVDDDIPFLSMVVLGWSHSGSTLG